VVTTGPATLGSCAINSSDGSPWFLDTGFLAANNSCGICPTAGRVTKLVQTVDVSAYANVFHTHAHVAIVYGGDAFALGKAAGSGTSNYRSQADYQAAYTVDLLDSAGNLLATDTSGFVFAGPNFACIFTTRCRQNYGYRQIVSVVPAATRKVRFTATMTDRLSVCYNTATSATFKNGFDNLWLVVGYAGPQGLGFEAGPAPDNTGEIR
jgi:hypothetical protein